MPYQQGLLAGLSMPSSSVQSTFIIMDQAQVNAETSPQVQEWISRPPEIPTEDTPGEFMSPQEEPQMEAQHQGRQDTANQNAAGLPSLAQQRMSLLNDLFPTGVASLGMMFFFQHGVELYGCAVGP